MQLGAWVAAAWVAAPVYIDGDADSCPGLGSDAVPYCSIDAAFDNADFEPGTEFLLRDAAEPYTDDAGSFTVSGRDGTPEAPLLIGADEGHAPVLRTRLAIENSSHWIVRGLTFEGSGVGSPRALTVSTSETDEAGIRVEGNTFIGWGGSVDGTLAILGVTAGGDLEFVDVTVRGNRVLGSTGRGILLSGVSDGLVEGNTVAGMGCEQGNDDASGIAGIQTVDSRDLVVRHNIVRDVDARTCPNPPAGQVIRAIGILFVRTDDSELAANWVSRIGMDSGHDAMGIAMAQGTDNPDVHHNVIVDGEFCGLCDDFLYSAGGVGTTFRHNTVVGGGFGIYAGSPRAFVATDNIIVGTSWSAVRMHRSPIGTCTPPGDPPEKGVPVCPDLSWNYERNIYGSEPETWTFEYSNVVDLEGWREGCDCDEESVAEDPDLPVDVEDFTPAGGGPAVDHGDAASTEPFNGSAPDAGAFEAPLIVAAEVPAADPDRVVLTFGGGSVGPLRFDPSCAGFVVTLDGEESPLAECEASGEGVVVVRLEGDVTQGQSAELRYAGPWVRDSAQVGGALDAVLQPVTVAIENNSQAEPGSEDTGGTSGGDVGTQGGGDSSASSTGEGSETTTEATSGDGAQPRGGFPDAGGCACTADVGGPGIWSGLWLLVLGARRRRPLARARRALRNPR